MGARFTGGGRQDRDRDRDRVRVRLRWAGATVVVSLVVGLGAVVPARADDGSVSVSASVAAAAVGGVLPSLDLLQVATVATGGPRDVFLASTAQRAALGRMEALAVSDVLVAHGLPAGGSAQVLTWARADVRAALWARVQGVIGKDVSARSGDEQLVYGWMQLVIARTRVALQQAAIDQFNAWTGHPGYGPGAYPSGPVRYTSDHRGGICDYKPPAPFQSDYTVLVTTVSTPPSGNGGLARVTNPTVRPDLWSSVVSTVLGKPVTVGSRMVQVSDSGYCKPVCQLAEGTPAACPVPRPTDADFEKWAIGSSTVSSVLAVLGVAVPAVLATLLGRQASTPGSDLAGQTFGVEGQVTNENTSLLGNHANSNYGLEMEEFFDHGSDSDSDTDTNSDATASDSEAELADVSDVTMTDASPADQDTVVSPGHGPGSVAVPADNTTAVPRSPITPEVMADPELMNQWFDLYNVAENAPFTAETAAATKAWNAMSTMQRIQFFDLHVDVASLQAVGTYVADAATARAWFGSLSPATLNRLATTYPFLGTWQKASAANLIEVYKAFHGTSQVSNFVMPSNGNFVDAWFSNHYQKITNYWSRVTWDGLNLPPPAVLSVDQVNALSLAQRVQYMDQFNKYFARVGLYQAWSILNPNATPVETAMAKAAALKFQRPLPSVAGGASSVSQAFLDSYAQQCKIPTDVWSTLTPADQRVWYLDITRNEVRKLNFMEWLTATPLASERQIKAAEAAFETMGLSTEKLSLLRPVVANTLIFDAGSLKAADSAIVDDLSPASRAYRLAAAESDYAITAAGVVNGTPPEIVDLILNAHRVQTQAVASTAAADALAQSFSVGAAADVAEAAAGVGNGVSTAARFAAGSLSVVGIAALVFKVVGEVSNPLIAIDMVEKAGTELERTLRQPVELNQEKAKYQAWVPDLHADASLAADVGVSPLALPARCSSWITYDWAGCWQAAAANQARQPRSSAGAMFFALMGATTSDAPDAMDPTVTAAAAASAAAGVVPACVVDDPVDSTVDPSVDPALSGVPGACRPVAGAAPVAAVSPGDPVFLVQGQGVTSSIQVSNEIVNQDWSGAPVVTRISGNWFVTGLPMGAQSQSLRWNYVDWSGNKRIAELTGTASGYKGFVSFPASSTAMTLSPRTCLAQGLCQSGTSIQVTGRNGGRYTAAVLSGVGAPQASMTPSTVGPVEGQPVTFAATPGPGSQANLNYRWLFQSSCSGCGTSTGQVETDGVSVTHTFTNAGPQPMTLIVTDPRGAQTRLVATVPVRNVAPVLSVDPVNPPTTITAPLVLTGIVRDPGTDEKQTVTATWCDGSTSIVHYPDPTGAAATAVRDVGLISFRMSHPLNVPASGCPVTVTDTDGPGAVSTVRLGPPAAPNALSVAVGDAQASVSFPAPDTHGAPIWDYRLTSRDLTTGAEGPSAASAITLAGNGITAAPPRPQMTVTGLINGHSYTFSVLAENYLGSTVSAPTGPITIGAPSPPAGLVANSGCLTLPSGMGQRTWARACVATLTFAPSAANGAAVTGYTMTLVRLVYVPATIINTGLMQVTIAAHEESEPMSTRALTPAEITAQAVDIGGLPPNQTYYFTLTATNPRGTSPPATSNPTTLPT